MGNLHPDVLFETNQGMPADLAMIQTRTRKLMGTATTLGQIFE